MVVDFLVENIEKYTGLLGKILPVHAQIPVFSNILLEADKEGFFLSATDLELGIRIKIPAKVTEEGKITIPGKHFLEIISTLSKEKVHLTTERDSLFVSSGNNKISFQTISADEFPDLFKKRGELYAEFTKESFKKNFSQIIFSVSQDETRPSLTGIFFQIDRDVPKLVTTDGFRLSIKNAQKNIFHNSSDTLILPARAINELSSLKISEEGIRMFFLKEGNQVFFEAGDVVLMGRLLGGEFPQYEAIIPNDFKTSVSLDSEALLQAIKLTSVFSRESNSIVNFEIKNGILKVFSKAAGVGEGETEIDVEQEGEDNEIAFNNRFVMDYLRNCNAKIIEMKMNSSLESAMFQSSQDKTFTHIIMPVRIQEE